MRICLLMGAFLAVLIGARGQSLDTPPFNFDRRLDEGYADSLITATKKRITDLDRYPVNAYTDTVRMELLYFVGYVYRSGAYRSDSTLAIAAQLTQMAKGNIKYRIKGILLREYYYRVNTRNYVEAMKANYEILDLMEKSQEEKTRNLWRINNNLGVLLYRMERFQESVVYLQKAIESFDLDPRAHPNQITPIYQSMGEAYRMDRQYEKALSCYQEALKILIRNKSLSNVSNFAYIYSDIAGAYRHLKDYPASLQNYQLSESYWKQLNNKAGLALVWASMADVYFLTGDYQQAIAFSEKGLQNAGNLPATYVQVYEVLFKSYEAQRKFEEALYHHKLLVSKTDSAKKAKNISEMMAVRANFEKEKLELELRREKELQVQRITLLEQQEEIERAKNAAEKQNLLKTIRNNELLSQLEVERITAESEKKQTLQQNTIKQLKINELSQKIKTDEQSRKLLYATLLMTGVLGLVLLWYNYKLATKNKLLKLKNEEIEKALVQGQRIERKRVASELHDNVNSILASVKASLQTLEPHDIRDVPAYANVMKMVDTATREVRQISHNMLPAELETEGLENALQALVIRLNLAGKTRFSLVLNGPAPRFEPAVAFNLYTICTELCQNIQKHAEATEARIELERIKGRLILFITDNGKGFRREEASEGMGLKNIDHRARTIGASLRVQSQPGEGTTFFLVLENA